MPSWSFSRRKADRHPRSLTRARDVWAHRSLQRLEPSARWPSRVEASTWTRARRATKTKTSFDPFSCARRRILFRRKTSIRSGSLKRPTPWYRNPLPLPPLLYLLLLPLFHMSSLIRRQQIGPIRPRRIRRLAKLLLRVTVSSLPHGSWNGCAWRTRTLDWRTKTPGLEAENARVKEEIQRLGARLASSTAAQSAESSLADLGRELKAERLARRTSETELARVRKERGELLFAVVAMRAGLPSAGSAPSSTFEIFR